MKSIVVLLLIVSVCFAAEYSFVGKQACYNQCEHLYKGQAQEKCFDRCSALPNSDHEDCDSLCSMFNGYTKEKCLKKCNHYSADGFPKKELCLMGCKMLKRDWQRELCEIGCNRIKSDSESELFSGRFKRLLEQGLKVGKQMGKQYLQKKGFKIASETEEFPKKELCLMGCKLLKKDWERQLCEIACNQIKGDDIFGGKPRPEPTPCEVCKASCIRSQDKVMQCLQECAAVTCKISPVEICKQHCVNGLIQDKIPECIQKCNQNAIKSDSEMIFGKKFNKIMKQGLNVAKEYGKKLLKEKTGVQLADDSFGGRPEPQPTPCQTCKSACVRAQMNIGKCIETCENTTCKLSPKDICKQKCIAQQFDVTKCMQKC